MQNKWKKKSKYDIKRIEKKRRGFIYESNNKMGWWKRKGIAIYS